MLNDGLTAVGVARPIRSAPSRDAPIVLRRGQRIGAVRWAVTGNSAEMRTAPPRSAVAYESVALPLSYPGGQDTVTAVRTDCNRSCRF